MKTKKKSKPKTRNGIAVKSWMLVKGITQAEIVRATGVNKGLVCRTVNGARNSRKVLNYLKSKRMPQRLLWDKQEKTKKK